jgi:hypothetical protein
MLDSVTAMALKHERGWRIRKKRGDRRKRMEELEETKGDTRKRLLDVGPPDYRV